ncbi:hypothetical protein [Schlesneria paludicola]|uniref:hypothetical protein n=1 Tax=Schlesneria paludicola TaxID=360056 RepID=UPI00029A1082|nr:hypothetical protein [Schlesneria paludicola]
MQVVESSKLESFIEASPQLGALTRFVTAARRGRFIGCGSGDEAAHALGQIILAHVTCLDGQMIDGLIEFISAAKYQRETARDLLFRGAR